MSLNNPKQHQPRFSRKPSLERFNCTEPCRNNQQSSAHVPKCEQPTSPRFVSSTATRTLNEIKTQTAVSLQSSYLHHSTRPSANQIAFNWNPKVSQQPLPQLTPSTTRFKLWLSQNSTTPVETKRHCLPPRTSPCFPLSSYPLVHLAKQKAFPSLGGTLEAVPLLKGG